jgi:thiamine biosynthesis lipoprotein
MGTVVSLRGADEATADEVRRVFDAYDRTYSLWDPASPLSAVARGELRLADTPDAVRDTYALALGWRDRTGGAFTPHRPDGVVDLSGIVKALAARDAGEVLDRRVPTGSWLLDAGGDVLVRGEHEGGAWTVGVVDPDDREALIAVVPLAHPRRAVATSGTAERGEHVWRRSAPVFRQATVVADDVVTADVLATAIVAGDEQDLLRCTSGGDLDQRVDVLAFGVDGRVWATPAIRATLAVVDTGDPPGSAFH